MMQIETNHFYRIPSFTERVLRLELMFLRPMTGCFAALKKSAMYGDEDFESLGYSDAKAHEFALNAVTRVDGFHPMN